MGFLQRYLTEAKGLHLTPAHVLQKCIFFHLEITHWLKLKLVRLLKPYLNLIFFNLFLRIKSLSGLTHFSSEFHVLNESLTQCDTQIALRQR